MGERQCAPATLFTESICPENDLAPIVLFGADDQSRVSVIGT